MEVKAFAAMEARAALVPYTYEAPTPGPLEVLLEVSHCGICHSDVHMVDNDWRISRFPLVPGHEVVGTIVAKGDAVDGLDIGQRVGVGWQSGSCMDCEWCADGQENLCATSTGTCVGRHGGFGTHMLTDSRFALPIPEGLASDIAAPLLCGGITVYSPLRRYGVGAGSRVGVVGIGGLGHLAVQFAHKMGAEVTAFTSSPDKQALARNLGANHVVNSRDPQAIKAARATLDLIVVSATAKLDWRVYVKALRPNGKVCFVAGSAGNLDIPAGMLIDGQKSVSGSVIGDPGRIREMLAFAAEHGVGAQIEVMPAAEVNTAMDRVRNNQARFRMVLEM
ncbi:MAG: NAD(P)-dependent alcohol dehydrogenase [Bacteroidota bacterium]